MSIKKQERIALDFLTFRYCHSYELYLQPEEWDVGGGNITIEEIDIIKKYPDVKHIAISGNMFMEKQISKRLVPSFYAG